MTQSKYATDYSAAEQMVVSAARQIEGNDVVYVGVGLPMQAGVLAKNLHAPNSTIVIENGIVRASIFPIPRATDNLHSQSYAEQLSGLFYVMCLAQAGYINTGFLGAGQIDRYGNCNDTAVGDYRNPIHRWQGSGGGNDVMSFCGRTIIILEQTKRRFLEKVDFNTCPGYLDGKPGRREEIGLPPNTGPAVVITDLATYCFEDGEMTLKTVHTGCGVTLEKVKAEISWDVKVADDITDTEPPTEEELNVYHEKIEAVLRSYGPRPGAAPPSAQAQGNPR
ncbi:MAG: CoA-transferase [Dehalococcoidales bacterium]